jgi:hypothetical protein
MIHIQIKSVSPFKEAFGVPPHGYRRVNACCNTGQAQPFGLPWISHFFFMNVQWGGSDRRVYCREGTPPFKQPPATQRDEFEEHGPSQLALVADKNGLKERALVNAGRKVGHGNGTLVGGLRVTQRMGRDRGAAKMPKLQGH